MSQAFGGEPPAAAGLVLREAAGLELRKAVSHALDVDGPIRAGPRRDRLWQAEVRVITQAAEDPRGD